MFLPSLLEYSIEDLDKKLDLVSSNLNIFKKLQQSENILYFHLDFVMPEFAKSINVQPSLEPSILFLNLQKYFKDNNLVLSIHLMGSNADLENWQEYFQTLILNSNWSCTIFLPHQNYLDWQRDIRQSSNLRLGIWRDLDEWKNYDFDLTQDYLLMTVKAGKSGQKLTEEIKNEVLDIVKNNQTKNFILDGGWSIDFQNSHPNAQIVSYSSFWKQFESALVLSNNLD